MSDRMFWIAAKVLLWLTAIGVVIWVAVAADA